MIAFDLFSDSHCAITVPHSGSMTLFLPLNCLQVLDVRKHPTVALNYGPQKCHVDNEIRLCLQYVSNTSVDEIPPYDKCRVLFKEARMANDIRSLWSN